MSVKVTKEWMTNYLKSSPDFLSDWVLNNVSLETLHEWKAEKTYPQKGGFLGTFKPFKAIVSAGPLIGQPKNVLQPSPPLATADVGDRRTISDLADFIEDPEKKQSRQFIRRKTTGELTEMQQEELFFELVIDIAHELAVDALCYKILANVAMLTGSDRSSLFLVRVNNKGEPYLESKLFDGKDPAGRVCTPMQEGGILIEIPFGKGIAGLVAQSKKSINVPDAYKDERFNQEIDRKTGYRTKCLLSMPIFNYEGSVIGVAQIMNKQGGTELFTQKDEEVFEKFLVFCGISLTNAELFGLSLNEFKMNKLLLMLAKDIFAAQSKLDNLSKRIMLDIQNIISCERCILYLMSVVLSEQDVEISRAFDMIVSDKIVTNPNEEALRKFPATRFALKVAKSSEPDEFDAHQSNEEALVSESGYVINNILSMPVFDMHNKVVGVVQMINKANNERFNPSDVMTVTTFALFCGLGICNCRAYENMVKMIARQRVNLDVLSYYAIANDSETDDLEKAAVIKSQKIKLATLDFSDASLNDFETCKAVVTIFTELDIVNRFKIQSNILCRWILSVKKNYRPALYHNWRHAFNVVQMMFYCLTVGQLTSVLSDLELFVMVVAALCHDLDYRPDTSRVKQPLAMLYSTLSVEHHYIDQCIMLLNNEKTNIFCNLANDDYKFALEMLENCILSTDLTLFYKKIKAFQDLVSQERIDWTVAANRSLLRAMLMVAADVSASCRPWAMHTKSAQLVFTDFVKQNEEATTGSKFLKSMGSIQKRIRDELPKLQLGFMDSICLPLYMLLSNVFPQLKPMYDACQENRSQWKKLGEEAHRRTHL